jgi:hypothetical protein
MAEDDFEDVDLSSHYGRAGRTRRTERVDDVDAAVLAHLTHRSYEAGVAAKLALVDSYGEDTYDDGAVIRFTKRLDGPRGPQDYTYAAIKADNHWYTTGPYGRKYTWLELLAWFVRGKHPVEGFETLTVWSNQGAAGSNPV